MAFWGWWGEGVRAPWAAGVRGRGLPATLACATKLGWSPSLSGSEATSVPPVARKLPGPTFTSSVTEAVESPAIAGTSTVGATFTVTVALLVVAPPYRIYT